jgi:hypothetical protein
MTTTTFTDKDNDTLSITRSITNPTSVRFDSRQKVGSDAQAILIFRQDEAERIRDKLIEMYPLPVQCAEVVHHDEPEPTSFGELAAFASAQGVTINIANLTINS